MKVLYTLIILLIPFVGFGQKIELANSNDSLIQFYNGLDNNVWKVNDDSKITFIETKNLNSLSNGIVGYYKFYVNPATFDLKIRKNKYSNFKNSHFDKIHLVLYFNDMSVDTLTFSKKISDYHKNSNDIYLKPLQTNLLNRIEIIKKSEKHNFSHKSYLQFQNYCSYSNMDIISRLVYNYAGKNPKYINKNIFDKKSFGVNQNKSVKVLDENNVNFEYEVFIEFDLPNKTNTVIDKINDLASFISADAIILNTKENIITNRESSTEILNSWDVILSGATPQYGTVYNDVNKTIQKTTAKIIKKSSKKTSNSTEKIDALDKLLNLYSKGLLTEEEFQKLKKEILK